MCVIQIVIHLNVLLWVYHLQLPDRKLILTPKGVFYPVLSFEALPPPTPSVGGVFKPQKKDLRYPLGISDLGTPKGTRTPDLLVRSQSLYPAELSTHIIPFRNALVSYHK